MYHSVSTNIDYGIDRSPDEVINVTYETRDFLPEVRVEFGPVSPIRTFIDTAEANYLMLALATALFDAGKIDMDTAERLSYLSNITLQDPREYEQAAADGAF